MPLLPPDWPLVARSCRNLPFNMKLNVAEVFLCRDVARARRYGHHLFRRVNDPLCILFAAVPVFRTAAVKEAQWRRSGQSPRCHHTMARPRSRCSAVVDPCHGLSNRHLDAAQRRQSR